MVRREPGSPGRAGIGVVDREVEPPAFRVHGCGGPHGECHGHESVVAAGRVLAVRRITTSER
jgi:hypothetical protein